MNVEDGAQGDCSVPEPMIRISVTLALCGPESTTRHELCGSTAEKPLMCLVLISWDGAGIQRMLPFYGAEPQH